MASHLAGAKWHAVVGVRARLCNQYRLRVTRRIAALALALSQLQAASMMDPRTGVKRSLPLRTPDREAGAPKRRRLVLDTASRTGRRLPPEMAGQMATFKLAGSPKRKAYKPHKRPSLRKGNPVLNLQSASPILHS